MNPKGDAGRRAVLVARTLLVCAGVSLVHFVVGFVWFLLRTDFLSWPAAALLASAVFFSGMMMATSLWMFTIVSKEYLGKRGSELRVQAIRQSPDIVIQLNDALRIVAVNPAAEKRFGHSASSLSGMPLGFLVPERSAPAKSETAPPPRPAVEAVPTARKLAARAGSRLSHLVQPLLGFTELALESLEPGHPVRTDLEEIGRASSRVVLLAQALEVYGGMSSGAVAALELNSLLEGLERDLRFALQPATALKLEVAGYPVKVLADPGLTRIAVLLLACNAEEAMPSGSAVTISVVPDGLTVADSGGGFAQPVYSTLFHPFTSTKPPERGVGLGLHVARAAMRLQQGDLQLTSSGESGTVLTLVFSTPLEDADPVRDSVGSEVAVASA